MIPKAVALSYIAAFMLLFLCVHIYAHYHRNPKPLAGHLIFGIGMVPGLLGVIYGFSLGFTQGGIEEGLAVTWAWLLLEMSAWELRRLLKGNREAPESENVEK